MTTMRKASPHGVAAAIRKERSVLDKERGGSIDEKPQMRDDWTLKMVSLLHSSYYMRYDIACGQASESNALAKILRAVALGVACLEQHGLPKESSE